MSQGTNRPLSLAYEPLDSQHILACERQPYRLVQGIVEWSGKGKWLETLSAKAPKPCCSNPDNLDIEGWFSMQSEKDKGAPDLYKFYCRVCESEFERGEAPGYCHVFFCVGGGDNRPMWEVR